MNGKVDGKVDGTLRGPNFSQRSRSGKFVGPVPTGQPADHVTIVDLP